MPSRKPMGVEPRRVVLASGSPRRRAFLEDLGLTFEVRAADIDETPFPVEDPVVYVERLARAKALAARRLRSDEVVIAADTTVVLDGEIIGKPTDDADAATILRRLSGRAHLVLSGVAVVVANSDPHSIVVPTTVTFANLSDNDIAWYIGTGEPHGKAGAYAIQGRGAALVRSVEGSVTNIVGLPLVELAELLTKAGAPIGALRG